MDEAEPAQASPTSRRLKSMDNGSAFGKDSADIQEVIERVYLPRQQPVEITFEDLAIIFECKDDCKTIMDIAHIKDMMRFTAHAVDDPLWREVCVKADKPVDGDHCDERAYQNLTHFVEPMIEKGQITDLAIQTFIQGAAQDKDNFGRMRIAVDKSFTPTHPYSKYLVAKLHYAGPVYKSKWELDESADPPV